MIDAGFGTEGEEYVAPLQLPAGAQIQQICLYGYNQGPAGSLGLGLDAVKLVPAGVSPGVVSIPGSGIVFDWNLGHGVICTDPSFSYTYRETGDVDGDGNLEHLAHQFSVSIHQNDDGVHTRFGGVGVFWRRQVSPPPAAASFADVPTTNGFFQFVEALAASGITAGCGGGNFCPDSPLTRGQMAVFLSKALGLHWPY
jgi:S-layer homology domain